MSTTPPPPPGSEGGFPPPPPSGPWASDSLPPYRTATANVVAQPPSIRTAVRLMWVGAATAVVTALSPRLQSDTIRDRLRDNSPRLTKSEVVQVALAITILVLLWQSASSAYYEARSRTY